MPYLGKLLVRRTMGPKSNAHNNESGGPCKVSTWRNTFYTIMTSKMLMVTIRSMYM